MHRLNYARRQQYRRLRRAAAAASASAAAALLALVFGGAGAISLAASLLILALGLGLGLYARQWFSLAGRSRVGARSEDQVQQALAVLEREGWRLRHSLRWPGSGDIHSVAIAPTGTALVIETKTRDL